MSPHCPSCDAAVDNLYECPECGHEHCVDCRLPDAHVCEPATAVADTTSDTEALTRRYAGLTPLQWLAVPAVWLLAQAGGGVGDGGLAYLSGQVFASFLIVYAAASLIERVRASALGT